ncbi:MAG: mechanosensitive ion channel family protein [Sandaracinaceae bacterium]|nr:mechanosensitive ion channel family protein [Sandaracinaceae bacterium]
MILYQAGVLAVAVVLIALLVHRFAPERRPHVRRAVLMFGLFLLAVGGEALARWLGAHDWERNLTALAQILFAINLIAVGGLAVFQLLLPALGVRLAAIVSDLVLGALYVAALLVGLRTAGLELTGIVTTSAVVTGILALSLQATLSNVIGGVALQVDGSIAVGDWVQLDNGKKGVVTRIGWRHTVLETNDWDAMIVPNTALLGSTFTILGKRGGQRVNHRMWVYFNVDFRFPPSEVIAVANTALQSAPIEGMLDDPKPNCVCMNFAQDGRDSMAYYAARYWITSMTIDDPTSSRVRARIYAALKRANIPLAVPAAHIWMEEDSQERRDRKKEKQHQRRLEALRALTFLGPLEAAELDLLAEGLSYVPFATGEVVTHQGANAHFLYIVVAGVVEVRVSRGDTDELVATLEGPAFVGEMGLMTGAPRSATVVARTDVECYRLDKASFENVLVHRPELAEAISELLAERAMKLAMVVDELEEAHPDRMEEEKSRVLHTIREFFGLGEP